MINALKRFVPKGHRHMKVLRGPFRGGMFYSSPHASLRKLFGLYEHELNPWIYRAIARSNLVIDVGANDGYFTFGALQAMKRHHGLGKLIAFEPSRENLLQLEIARAAARISRDDIRLIDKFVGAADDKDTTTLDALPEADSPQVRALIKIDVEGAELDVLSGARKWIKPESLFLIEVHEVEFFDKIRSIFSAAGVELQKIGQVPLPLLGSEQRDPTDGWLVTKIP